MNSYFPSEAQSSFALFGEDGNSKRYPQKGGLKDRLFEPYGGGTHRGGLQETTFGLDRAGPISRALFALVYGRVPSLTAWMKTPLTGVPERDGWVTESYIIGRSAQSLGVIGRNEGGNGA